MIRAVSRHSHRWAIILAFLSFTTNLRANEDEKDPVDAELQKHLQEQSGEDLGLPSSEPPMVLVSRKMREAEQLMQGSKDHEETRRVQESIVQTLDEMIQRRTRKQTKSSQSAGKSSPGKEQSPPQPGKPSAPKPSSSAGDSQTSRPNSASDAQNVENKSPQSFLQEWWGHLPARARQRVSQEWGEEFLPKYESQLEDYFRGLAEESNQNRP